MNSRDKLTKLANYFYNDENPSFDTMQYFKDIDNDLEILEILKDKKVDIGYVNEMDLEDYNEYILQKGGTYYKLTKEQYDLIEQWLEEKEYD